jgi:hypothetical protein
MGEFLRLLEKRDTRTWAFLIIVIVSAVVAYNPLLLGYAGIHVAAADVPPVRLLAIGVALVTVIFVIVLSRKAKEEKKEMGKGDSMVQTTSGANSPIVSGQVAAARDIHITVPPSSANSQESEVFAHLEATVPDVLQELRRELKEDPLIRDIICLERKSIPYGWPDTHLMFSEEEYKDIRRKLQVLVNAGMIRETKEGFAFRISERLVRYLR